MVRQYAHTQHDYSRTTVGFNQVPLETEQISKTSIPQHLPVRRQHILLARADQVTESWHLNSSELNDNKWNQQDRLLGGGSGGRAAYLLDCSVPVTSAIVNTSLPAAHISYSEHKKLQGFLLAVTLVSACKAFILLGA